MTKRRILITGANGFIGSSLCDYFRGRDFEVFGLVRPQSDLHFLDGLDVQLIRGDLLQPKEISLPADIELVIHSASIVSDNANEEQCLRGIYQVAVNLFEKVTSSCPRLERIVYISSTLTLGYIGTNISERNPGKTAMFMPYARYKKKTEEYFQEQHQKNGTPIVVLRPADVYGPRDRTSCALMLRECERGLPLIVGTGNHLFGYCYIGNLCQAAYLAATKDGIGGKFYTVANRLPITWRRFFSGFQRGLGKKQHVYVPVSLTKMVAAYFELRKKINPRFTPPINFYRIRRITTDSTFDISATISELGYQPDENVDEQIAAIVAWYKAERKSGHIR